MSTTDPKESIRTLIAFNSRDWGKDPADAWLYGIVFGWDPEPGEEESAIDELAEAHGWDERDVARLRLLHERWVALA